MATAVKMDSETKSRLEELQAEVKLRTGRKVTQQELLARLVNSAYDSKAAFVDSFREGAASLSESELDAFFEPTFDSGVETDEDDVDEVLYE